MTSAIKPPTQIFLIGQAPNREPYTSLYKKLEGMAALNQASITWVNTDSNLFWYEEKIRSHSYREYGWFDSIYGPEPTINLAPKASEHKLVSHSTKGEIIELDPINFGGLVSPESNAPNITALNRLVSDASDPIVIVLPWQFDYPLYERYRNRGKEIPFHFPRQDGTSTRLITKNRSGIPVCHIPDDLIDKTTVKEIIRIFSEMTLKNEQTVKNNRDETKFNTAGVSNEIKMDQLERIAESNWDIMETELRGATPEAFTETQEAVITSLRKQADAIRTELGSLRQNRDTKQSEIDELVAKQNEILADIQSKYDDVEIRNAEVDEKLARLARIESGNRIVYNCAIDSIVAELEKIHLAETFPSKIRKIFGKGVPTKALLDQVVEIVENDCKAVVNAYRMGEALNTNEAIAMAVIQVALQKIGRDPRKVDKFANIRIEPAALAKMIENSFEENQAQWLEVLLDKFPEYVRQSYLAILSSNEILQDETRSTVGRDFIKLIRERRIQSQIEEQTDKVIAEVGGQTQAQLPLAFSETKATAVVAPNGSDIKATITADELGGAQILQLGV